MRMTACLIAALIGAGCCIVSLLDARTQQAAESSPAFLGQETARNGQPPYHRMRGWTQHQAGTSPTG